MQTFTPEIVEEIKSYVYLYSDPDTKKVFYVGKGIGNRCFEHLDYKSNSVKTKKIESLKKQGKEPIIELLRYGLTDKEASLVEASLIDFLEKENLSNIVRGIHSNSVGRETVEDIILSYSAEQAIIDDDVILIILNKIFHSKMSPEELYESTRGTWKIGPRREKAKFVFAVYQGIVREVYEITKWHKAGTLTDTFRDSDKKSIKGRWEFEGHVANQNIRDKYLKKSIRKYSSKKNQNPINYVNS